MNCSNVNSSTDSLETTCRDVIRTEGRRRTIAAVAAVEGFGFWTGTNIRVEFHPASPGRGLYFIRTDLPEPNEVPARVEWRIAKPRQTSLAVNGVRVDMIEHLIAAIRGLGIDDLEIRVNAPEMPGLDGSAASFVEAIRRAGTVELSEPRRILTIGEKRRFGTEDRWIEVAPSQNDETIFGYTIDYGNALPQNTAPPIPNQSFESRITPDIFAEQIAPARTFLLKTEADALRNAGIATRVTEKDVLVFENGQILSNTFRFENECARHKVLDMIGDFSLADLRIRGEVRAFRTGHQENAAVLAALLAGACEHPPVCVGD